MVQVRIGAELWELSWDEWEHRVRGGLVPPDALVCFAPVTGTAWRPASELELFTSLRNEGALAFRAGFRASAPPLATALLVGVQLRIWWAAQVPAVAAWLATHTTRWTAPTLEDAEVWRPLTMGLVHIGFVHLSMNLLFLAYTAYNLERSLGWRNLLWIYGTAVTVGSLLGMWASPQARSLGASGGVFGLIAASVVFGFQRPDLLPSWGRRYFGFALVPYLLVMGLSGAFSDNTDNWSHLGGAIAGALLGLVADPPTLQRRPGWSRAWHLTTLGVGGALLAALAVVGPRVSPLRDADVLRATLARRELPPVAVRDPAVLWSAPGGWSPGRLLDAHEGWLSPLSPRGWSVRAWDHGAPASLQDLARDWGDRLALRAGEGWQIEVSAPEPTTLAGAPGLRVAATASRHDQTVLLEHRVTTRGVHALSATWQVEADRAERLASLHTRLLASVRWREPRDLDQARARHEARGGAPAPARDLALALLRAGEPEEAWALRRAAVDDRPDPADLVLLLQALTWYPSALEPDPDLLELAASLDAPAVTVALAEALDALGRAEEARGLRAWAWARAPGERSLRRDRAARALDTGITSEGLPTQFAWGAPPLGRRDAPPPWRDLPAGLESARAAAAWLAARDTALADAAAKAHDDGDRGVLALTVVLALDGAWPLDPVLPARRAWGRLTVARDEGRALPHLPDPGALLAAFGDVATFEASLARALRR